VTGIESLREVVVTPKIVQRRVKIRQNSDQRNDDRERKCSAGNPRNSFQSRLSRPWPAIDGQNTPYLAAVAKLASGEKSVAASCSTSREM